METQSSSRNSLVVFAFMTVTVAAWAAAESLSDSSWVPYTPPSIKPAPAAAPVESVAPANRLDPTPADPLPLNETLSANETVVKPPKTRAKRSPTRKPAAARKAVAPKADAAAKTAAPPKIVSMEQTVRQPPIVVESRRLSLDERIRSDVMDRIAAEPNLSGKIGVESRGANVRLSGYTSTAAQAGRAGRAAASVEGVRSVRNDLRARIGGSV